MRIPPPEHQQQGLEYCSHPWCGFRPHRGVLCPTLECRPDESSECSTAALSWRGSTSRPLYRDLAQLAGIGRYCHCLPIPSLLFARYFRESQDSSRYCRPLSLGHLMTVLCLLLQNTKLQIPFTARKNPSRPARDPAGSHPRHPRVIRATSPCLLVRYWRHEAWAFHQQPCTLPQTGNRKQQEDLCFTTVRTHKTVQRG